VDLMRLTLGEVYVRQFHALLGGTNLPVNTALATNLLHHARGHFDQIIHHLTNSPYVGKASLNRAWCLWEEAQLLADASKLIESQKAFQTAIDRLPKSLEQAQARFKLADSYARLKDYQTALTHYHLVLESYADVPEAREKLLDHAWYQVLRARIEMKDLPGAEAALERILQDYRSGAWGDHALLQYGKALLETGEFAKGQETLAQLKKLFPESALLPESQLAVAGSFAKQSNWPAAIQGFTEWLARFTNHLARSQTEFDRAWCFYQSGNQTNAFQLFTNLVHQYPGSPSTPLAQLWVADHYFNQRDYQTAEIYYQLVSTNAAPVELTQHASLMAAKAAFFRTAYSDARKYLTQLVSGQVHPEVGPEAWFMLGDIELEESRVSTNKLARFEEAINYFERVTKFHAASRHAPLAMGKIAHCHFQLGTQNPNRYEMATNQYVQLLSAAPDVPTRSEAEVSLGRVLEKMAEQRPNRTDLLNAALDHYLNVVYGNRLKKGEDPDPYWVSRAALAAGTLAVDQLQLFDRAERLYESMQVHFPAHRAEWDKRLEKLRQQRSK
jgi:TolA-binding protein